MKEYTDAELRVIALETAIKQVDTIPFRQGHNRSWNVLRSASNYYRFLKHGKFNRAGDRVT